MAVVNADSCSQSEFGELPNQFMRYFSTRLRGLTWLKSTAFYLPAHDCAFLMSTMLFRTNRANPPSQPIPHNLEPWPTCPGQEGSQLT